MSLTPKQKRFVHEYLVDGNATRSAIAAGYSEKTAGPAGARLLKNVNVCSQISQLTAKRCEKLEITADYVLNGIKETVERCRQSTPVLDRKGKPVMIEAEDGEIVPAYTFNALGALKGYELLGKHLELFTDKVKHSGSIEYTDLSHLSDAQLDEIEHIVESANTQPARH